jgi:hypothetical protein
MKPNLWMVEMMMGTPAVSAGELGGVGVDLLHDAGLVLELIDRVLELAVEHGAVGQHHHGVVDLPVLLVVQRGEPMGQPGDGVGLAGARRVLRQVVGPGAGLLAAASSRVTQSHWWKRGKIIASLVVTLPVFGSLSSVTCRWMNRPTRSSRLSRCQMVSQR